MKRTNKKGFTIVELVIVIAVIAILAAVLIPNISRLVKKAQISSDLSLVRNLNMALETESATMDYPTAYSAFQAVKENGYDIAKIEAKASNNQILYDEVNKCFAYMNGSKLEYYPNSTKSDKTTPDHQLWAVYTDSTKAKDSKYSVYWNGATAFNGTVKAGFDAGDTTGNDVTYSNDAVQSVVIRTNGGKLTVNAAGSHVEHYGMATQITVTAVSNSTYVEHGTVATLTVGENAKRVVIKSEAVVVKLIHNSTSVSVENSGYIGSKDGNGEVSGTTVGGTTIKVSTFDQLQGLALASTIGADVNGKTIELTNDIDLTGKDWKPFGFAKEHPFDGTIDGKGYTIKGLSPNGYNPTTTVANVTNQATGVAYGFICSAKDASVKNINFVDVNIAIENGLNVGAVVGDARGSKLIIDNVTVSGSVSAMDKVGGFVGVAGYNDSTEFALTIKNSTNNANVNAVSTESYNRAGGFVGGLGGSSETTSACKTVTFTECVNNGNVSVTGNIAGGNESRIVNAAGFIGSANGSASKEITLKGCSNTGSITAVNTNNSETASVSGNNQDSYASSNTLGKGIRATSFYGGYAYTSNPSQN